MTATTEMGRNGPAVVRAESDMHVLIRLQDALFVQQFDNALCDNHGTSDEVSLLPVKQPTRKEPFCSDRLKSARAELNGESLDQVLFLSFYIISTFLIHLFLICR